MPTQSKTSYFLPAQYAELACGGIKQTSDSVILSKVKLQSLGNRSVFPAGCDQYDFHLRNTGLTSPFQVRFKAGSCTLWYVFQASSVLVAHPMQPQTVSSDLLDTDTLFSLKITSYLTLSLQYISTIQSMNIRGHCYFLQVVESQTAKAAIFI